MNNLKRNSLIASAFLIGFFGSYLIVEKVDFEKIAVQKIPGESLSAVPINAKLNRAQSQYYYVNKDATLKPKVSAEAYLVGDLGTGEVILAKNEVKKMPIASISKLMTALVATEIAKEEDVAKISKRAVATLGGNGELKAGEKIKVKDLV